MNTVTATLIRGIKRFIFYVTEEGEGWGADGVEEGGGTEIGWMKGRSRQTEKRRYLLYVYMMKLRRR